jgi:predicted NUDIX family phosphoesterase
MTFAKPALVTTRTCLREHIGDLETGMIDLDDLDNGAEDFFDKIETYVADRATCETNPEEQQLLPYVTLISPEGNFYVYGRGKEGGEGRLHGKLSIGLGGHVDTATFGNLYDHLHDEAGRELEEEVGLEPDTYELTFSHLISDQEPDGKEVSVGSVHLGIWGWANIEESQLGAAEKDVIVGGEWHDLDWLVANVERFEPWSKMAIAQLVSEFSGMEMDPDEVETLPEQDDEFADLIDTDPEGTLHLG